MSSTKILAAGALFLLVVAFAVVTLSGSRVWRQGGAGPGEVRATDRVGGDDNGVTQLMRLSLKGDVSAVKALLELGADVNATDKDGETALMAASFNGNARVVRTLLEHGAEVNRRSKTGWTALDLAVKRGNDEVRELLVKRGATR